MEQASYHHYREAQILLLILPADVLSADESNDSQCNKYSYGRTNCVDNHVVQIAGSVGYVMLMNLIAHGIGHA